MSPSTTMNRFSGFSFNACSRISLLLMIITSHFSGVFFWLLLSFQEADMRTSAEMCLDGRAVYAARSGLILLISCPHACSACHKS